MRWRLRAQQARIHAANMKDGPTKTTLLAMADHWDSKAGEAEALPWQEPGPPPAK